MQHKVVFTAILLLSSQVHAAATATVNVTDALKEASTEQRESYKRVQKVLYGTEVTSAEDTSTEKSGANSSFKIHLNRR